MRQADFGAAQLDLPPEIGRCRDLRTLSLSTASIPSSLWRLTELTELISDQAASTAADLRSCTSSGPSSRCASATANPACCRLRCRASQLLRALLPCSWTVCASAPGGRLADAAGAPTPQVQQVGVRFETPFRVARRQGDLCHTWRLCWHAHAHRLQATHHRSNLTFRRWCMSTASIYIHTEPSAMLAAGGCRRRRGWRGAGRRAAAAAAADGPLPPP